VKLNQVELNKLQSEAYDHLWNGRYRLALKTAKSIYLERPNDSEAAICLAWALLENGSPTKAIDYANLAVELRGDSIRTHLCRGYILMRLNIYEGAISDLDMSIEDQKGQLAWSYHNKARTLASMGNFTDAKLSFKLCNLIDNTNANWQYISKYYDTAEDLEKTKNKLTDKKVIELLKQAEEALKDKEPWFSLHISNIILKDSLYKKYWDEAIILELESMLHLFRFRPALQKANEIKQRFHSNKKFKRVLAALEKMQDEDSREDDIHLPPPIRKVTSELEFSPKIYEEKTTLDKRSNFAFFQNDYADIFSVKMFDYNQVADKERKYYEQFNITKVDQIGVEVIFANPNFRQKNKTYECSSKWYLNDFLIFENKFPLQVDMKWDSVIFDTQCGSHNDISWAVGQARVEIFIYDFKVCEKWFFINHQSLPTMESIPDKDADLKNEIATKEAQKSLEELLAELDSYIGLDNIKVTVRSFISFLSFQQEREKKGFKTDKNILMHAVFSGNPGTGKTTIARMLGEIFKSLGILKKGHVVEVDRAALVGQYVGETAQKTEKIIDEAMGGILFIDEAYTLVKKGGGQDFGQEAIDIILKRMEDKAGEFVVFVAGYPEEMETFIGSNPGLKSRFNHHFNFQDYTPDELLKIFDMYLEKDEYKITSEAKDELNSYLTSQYRKRDKSFGNARLVKQILEKLKLQLSNRFTVQDVPDKSDEVLTTISIKDISEVIKPDSEKHVHIPINENDLTEALAELHQLIGLDNVKSEISDLVKLVRYFIDQGEDIKEKLNSHILFLGNPGTGKTTVARIISKIYSSLGILPKGHLIECDRQNLVSNHIGGTAEKTKLLIDKAIGGTLFIDEAYTLSQKDGSSQDFGKEAIETILKRMEDDRGKFIVIAAGYTEEMKSFIESNPGIQSRFTKTFTFEDYIPDELMEITERYLISQNLELEIEAKEFLNKHYNEIYRTRDKHFGNARVVRNLLEKSTQRRLLRLAELPTEEREIKESLSLTKDDITQALGSGAVIKKYHVKGDPEKLESLMTELKSLVGLDGVKSNVEKLLSSLQVLKLRKERGLKIIVKPFHSVFIGNPGTGKTTVARLISKIYRELGLLEKGHLIEVDRADLVAGYQGQTAIKTDKIIKDALGGTLFIDEAYTLSRGGNDFGQEAIDTILKRMEDYKDQLVIIVAGYTDEMNNFLQSNSGLQSRFTNTFIFEDYTPRQLLYIAADIAAKNGYKLDEGALQLLLELFTNLYSKRDKNFGNARTAKNILYEAISNQEERIYSMYEYNDEDLITITFDDVEQLINN